MLRLHGVLVSYFCTYVCLSITHRRKDLMVHSSAPQTQKSIEMTTKVLQSTAVPMCYGQCTSLSDSRLLFVCYSLTENEFDEAASPCLNWSDIFLSLIVWGQSLFKCPAVCWLFELFSPCCTWRCLRCYWSMGAKDCFSAAVGTQQFENRPCFVVQYHDLKSSKFMVISQFSSMHVIMTIIAVRFES